MSNVGLFCVICGALIVTMYRAPHRHMSALLRHMGVLLRHMWGSFAWYVGLFSLICRALFVNM